jgi:hypothetical protein
VTPSFDGTVVRKPFAQGSKSERDAVVLATSQGDFLLRREGGNPFVDPVLEGLVGKAVRFDGVVVGSTLVVSDWTETDPAEAAGVSTDAAGDGAGDAGAAVAPEEARAPDGTSEDEASQENGASFEG